MVLTSLGVAVRTRKSWSGIDHDGHDRASTQVNGAGPTHARAVARPFRQPRAPTHAPRLSLRPEHRARRDHTGAALQRSRVSRARAGTDLRAYVAACGAVRP